MKSSKVPPQRMCCGCRRHLDKARLIRIVKTPSGEVVLDRSGKLSGRGAYFCGDPDCLKKLKKSRRLDASIGAKVPDEIYERLESNADAVT